MFENGADAGISDGKGHSILHKPISDGEMEIVKGLLGCGADPSKGLQVALEFYYVDIVKLLIAKGADVNKVSIDVFQFFPLKLKFIKMNHYHLYVLKYLFIHFDSICKQSY